MKLRGLLFGLLILLLVAASFVLPACSTTTASNLTEPPFASQITENLLLAVNAGDYSAFSKDFDASLIKALPAQSFPKQFTGGIQGKIGNYQANSKRFFQASSQAQFITVIYYAVYSMEPGAVLIQISFTIVEGRPLVSGLFFNSPKLRG